MCVSVSAARKAVYYLHAVSSGGQKRVSDPLGLELQVVVNHHVDTGN